MRDDVVAIGEDSDRVHLCLFRKSRHELLESSQSVFDPRIVLNVLLGIDEPEWLRVFGFQPLQEGPDHVLFGFLAQALGHTRPSIFRTTDAGRRSPGTAANTGPLSS